MRTFLCFAITILASSAFAALQSPNGQFRVEINQSNISILDPRGAPVFVVNQGELGNTRGTEVKWSSDSAHLVILIQYWKGDMLYALWYDGSQWHKASPTDFTLPAAELAREAGVSGYLKVQQSGLGSWLDSRRIAITGTLTYSGSAKQVPYGFTLVFTDGPTTGRTRAGFETGLVKAVDWHVR